MALESDLRLVMAPLLGMMIVTAGCDRQSAPPPQEKAPQANLAAPKAPEATGTVDISHRGEAMPIAVFEGPEGDQVTLGDFRGKPVLVNLWATWCGPCKAEMASLDALAVRQEAALTVLTVSQDSARAKVDAYMAERKFAKLGGYLDAQLRLGDSFGTGMVPTTVLYDKDGKEVWRVIGAMDWDGPRANTLMAEVLGG
jgi:thiol-disulfide isomerase/thioredoxin